MHQVYGDSVPHRIAIFRWIKRFKEGQDNLKNDPRKGRPSTSTSDKNVKAVQDLVEKDRQITIDDIATTLEISHRSAFSSLTDKSKFFLVSGNTQAVLSKLSARWALKSVTKRPACSES